MANKNKEVHIDEQVTESAEVAETETVEVTENVSVEAAGTEEETTASVEPVQLQINDLQGLGQIINLACKRGAFEAGEMETIGKSYNKLNAFLGYVAAQASKAKGDDAENTESTETATTDAPEAE